MIKNNAKVALHYLKLTDYYNLNLDFQKVDKHTGSMWLIHNTKHRKDNQFQSLEKMYIKTPHHKMKNMVMNRIQLHCSPALREALSNPSVDYSDSSGVRQRRDQF